jgi:hypothetical protein
LDKFFSIFGNNNNWENFGNSLSFKSVNSIVSLTFGKEKTRQIFDITKCEEKQKTKNPDLI